jgi:putative acyl-CoA dehydrogenase
MAAPGRLDETDIFNQSPPYEDLDLYGSDQPLQDAVNAHGAASEASALSAFGRRWGSAEMLEHGRLANENAPKLKTFDAKGFRRDIVEFHPSYHRLMAQSLGDGLHATTWQSNGHHAPPPAEVARGARFYMSNQVEAGHHCPVTMTRAAVAALSAETAVLDRLMPKILSRQYDPRFIPWWEKAGMTIGMGMTERQGGTDVRANTTRAVPARDGYAITGHKWFMSAPMCDAFLVLAQAPGGLSCFLMPRFRPDGSTNAIQLQRLKDKLGNRSNASCEVEFHEAFAWRVGEEGRGVRTIIEMVQVTRVDCALASAGFMRFAVAQAVHHTRYRRVFQRLLVDQPLMRAVLADLALEVEGAVALVMRLCRALDGAGHDPVEAAHARLLIPAAKYWVCKSAPSLIYEALECLGGNGYVEEGALARLYREAPLNAIWEGSGNVMCLDVLRAVGQDRDAAGEVIAALAHTTAHLPHTAEVAQSLMRLLTHPDGEGQARAAVELIAMLAATAALSESAAAVAPVFARVRLGRTAGTRYGTAALAPVEANQLINRVLAM